MFPLVDSSVADIGAKLGGWKEMDEFGLQDRKWEEEKKNMLQIERMTQSASYQVHCLHS